MVNTDKGVMQTQLNSFDAKEANAHIVACNRMSQEIKTIKLCHVLAHSHCKVWGYKLFPFRQANSESSVLFSRDGCYHLDKILTPSGR